MQTSTSYFKTDISHQAERSSDFLDTADVLHIVTWVALTNSIFFCVALALHRGLDTIGLVNFNTSISWLTSGYWYDIPLAALMLSVGWLWRYSVPKCLYRYEKTFKGDGLSELGHGIANGISIYMLICFLVVSMSLFSSL